MIHQTSTEPAHNKKHELAPRRVAEDVSKLHRFYRSLRLKQHKTVTTDTHHLLMHLRRRGVDTHKLIQSHDNFQPAAGNAISTNPIKSSSTPSVGLLILTYNNSVIYDNFSDHGIELAPTTHLSVRLGVWWCATKIETAVMPSLSQ